MKKILIVEDDDTIHNLIKELLQTEHYITKDAYSGTEALTVIENEDIDLILLDLMLPGMSGEEIIKKVNKTIPIIVLSAKVSSEDKVKALINGANDYITKPFNKKELLARIQVYKDIELLEDIRSLKIKEDKITLTRIEYTIMRELLSNPNKVITKTRLLDLISRDMENCDENSLKVHISNIRKKIKNVTQELKLKREIMYPYNNMRIR